MAIVLPVEAHRVAQSKSEMRFLYLASSKVGIWVQPKKESRRQCSTSRVLLTHVALEASRRKPVGGR